MHKSYNIPLPGRKLLPLTQITPHPCTRVKNSMATEKDKNSTSRQTTHPRFSLQQQQQPLTEHKPKCLRICQRQLLPVNSQQLLTRVGAMEDGSAAHYAQLLPLSTAHRVSSPSQQAVRTGQGRAPRFWGSSRRALEYRGASACPGPSISPVRPGEEEELEGNIRDPTSHLPARTQVPSPWGPAGLHCSLVTSLIFLGRLPSSHPHTNFPNSAAA